MSTSESGRKPDHSRHYVDRVLEDTQRYARDVLAENERLRLLVASLESERTRLEERNGVLQGIQRENQALQDLLASIDREKQRLQQQFLELRDESEHRAREQSRLREEIATIADRSRVFSQQLLEIERQNSNLANLYVASYQLHGSVERADVLASIIEILANLVGTEQVAIFEMDGSERLLPLCLNGVDPGRYREVKVGSGTIGRAVASGELYMVGASGANGRALEDPELTACIPLRLGGRVIGAIAIFALLPQKPALGELDRELFDLLATHAATALYCASLHARARAGEASAS